MLNATGNTIRILPLKDYLPDLGFGRSIIYELLKQRKFPPPVRPGKRSTFWHDALIEDFKRQILIHGEWALDRIEDPELKRIADNLARQYWNEDNQAA